MKKIVLIYFFAIVFVGCNRKSVEAELIDSNQTKVVVKEVPMEKKTGDTIWITKVKEKPYPYVYLPDSAFAHYRAVVK